MANSGELTEEATLESAVVDTDAGAGIDGGNGSPGGGAEAGAVAAGGGGRADGAGGRGALAAAAAAAYRIGGSTVGTGAVLGVGTPSSIVEFVIFVLEGVVVAAKFGRAAVVVSSVIFLVAVGEGFAAPLTCAGDFSTGASFAGVRGGGEKSAGATVEGVGGMEGVSSATETESCDSISSSLFSP